MRLPRPILEEIKFQGVVLRGFFLQLEFFIRGLCGGVLVAVVNSRKIFEFLWERLRPMSPRTHSLKALTTIFPQPENMHMVVKSALLVKEKSELEPSG